MNSEPSVFYHFYYIYLTAAESCYSEVGGWKEFGQYSQPGITAQQRGQGGQLLPILTATAALSALRASGYIADPSFKNIHVPLFWHATKVFLSVATSEKSSQEFPTKIILNSSVIHPNPTGISQTMPLSAKFQKCAAKLHKLVKSLL